MSLKHVELWKSRLAVNRGPLKKNKQCPTLLRSALSIGAPFENPMIMWILLFLF